MPNEPALTVLMLTQPSRDRLRAAAWAALRAQTDAGAVEVLILADPGSSVDALGALTLPAWAGAANIAVQAWPTLTDKLNAGFKLAKAPFVTFWDDDDWSEPRRLAKTLDAIGAVRADVYGPAQMHRHELVAPTRRTLLYTSPWGLPCLNGTVIRRDLARKHPFEALHAKPTEHNLSAWLLDRKRHPEVDFATIDVSVVAMAHTGGVNHPTQYRVDAGNSRVLDGDEYKSVGSRGATMAVMGEEALMRFEAAVR